MQRTDSRPVTFQQEWEIRYSSSRSRAYFYSSSTKESVWDRPAGLTDAAILQLKGSEYLNQAPPGKVRASHLLIKHKDSRRPGSWKTPVITRTIEEATETLRGHQAALLAAPDLQAAFAALAKTESDCSSARDGGDLGWFGPKQMQKPFEDTTFATEVGKMSEITSTDSGVHLILRTG
ncbi:hypothetical protein RQP46_006343 [Phenoliferia psychrophenolica]